MYRRFDNSDLFNYRHVALTLICVLLTVLKTVGQQFSADGKFVAVEIDKSLATIEPGGLEIVSSIGNSGLSRTRRKELFPKELTTNPILVLQSIDGKWKKEIKKGKKGQFSKDSKWFFCQVSDSLLYIRTNTQEHEIIPAVKSFSLSEINNNSLLVYELNSKTVVVFNVETGEKKEFLNSVTYEILKNNFLLLSKSETFDKVSLNSIELIDLKTYKQHIIWEGSMSVISYTLSHDTKSLAFLLKDKSAENVASSIYIYKMGRRNADKYFSDSSLIKERLSNKKILFTPDDSKLIFYLERELKDNTVKSKDIRQDVEVWGYFDPMFMTRQVAKVEQGNSIYSYAACLNIEDKRTLRLEYENEVIVESSIGGSLLINNEYVVVRRMHLPYHLYPLPSSYHELYEYNWNSSLMSTIKLVSLENGSTSVIQDSLRLYSANLPYLIMSPKRNFLIYFNWDKQAFFSYEFRAGIHRNISEGIEFLKGYESIYGNIGLYYDINYLSAGFFAPEQDLTFIVRDSKFQLWKLSLTNSNKKEVLVGDYVTKNKIVIGGWGAPVLKDGGMVVRDDGAQHFGGNVFDYGGFFKIKQNKIETLLKPGGLYSYRLSAVHSNSNDNLFLVSRENMKTPLEYVLTKDFKTFTPITSSAAEERMAERVEKEIVYWKTYSGKKAQGMLMKPKGFDPQRKYPVIVNYYEDAHVRADFGVYDVDGGLAGYGTGYLLFIPQIYQFPIGEVCQNTYDYVVSGVKEITKRSYVDSSKIGIIGNSFGGLETNCLITMTDIFAAAITYSGYSDLVSAYLADNKMMGRHGQGAVEVGQNRIGATLWARPDLYIKNSPIFYADKVTMPVLLVHYKGDYNVLHLQAEEFYRALRRNGKKVWLVSSDYASHGGPISDYARHFFEHYLKGMPPRKWMTQGVPGYLKGIDNGFAIDSLVTEPPAPTLYKDEIMTPQQKELYKKRTKFTKDGRIIDVKPAEKN